jgi:uncharacterized protein YcfJ
MPFAIGKEIASVVVSAVMSTSGEYSAIYGTIEKTIPIERVFFQPTVQQRCEVGITKRCWDEIIMFKTTKIVGHYVTYRNNGKLITVEHLL